MLSSPERPDVFTAQLQNNIYLISPWKPQKNAHLIFGDDWRQGSCERGTSCVFCLLAAPAPFDTFGHISLVMRQESGCAAASEGSLRPPSENKH